MAWLGGVCESLLRTVLCPECWEGEDIVTCSSGHILEVPVPSQEQVQPDMISRAALYHRLTQQEIALLITPFCSVSFLKGMELTVQVETTFFFYI